MEQNPYWEADSRSTVQGFPLYLTTISIRFITTVARPTLDSTQSQMNPVHTLTPYSFKIYFNNILPSMPSSSIWSLLSGFLLSFYMLSLSNPPYLITQIFGEEYKLWSCSLCNFLHSPVTSHLLSPNIPLRWEPMFHIHTKQQVKL
jgi:hypothetical protein